MGVTKLSRIYLQGIKAMNSKNTRDTARGGENRAHVFLIRGLWRSGFY